MYTTYFGLREPPFDVTPDPRFFYTNPTYHEVTASLNWGIKARKGFILLTGDAGTGKTTLLRRLITDLEGSVRFGLISNPALNLDDLLSSACAEFGLAVGPSRFEKLAALNAFLISQFEKGGTAALLIDEAQHLEDEVLESLRLLSNLETSTQKLLQIVLAGQPELELKLSRPRLGSLKQRLAIQCRLSRLRAHEIGAYVRYRLAAAGHRGRHLFGPDAVEEIAGYSKGVPRLINTICDNALLIAYASSEQRVSAPIIREVARDLGLEPSDAWAATIGEDSMAIGVLEGARAKGRATRPRTGSIRFRASSPVLAALSLLALAASAAFGWQTGTLVLAGARRGLESLRAGVAIPKDPVKTPELLLSANPDPDPGRSAAASADTVITHEPVEPTANHGLSPPAAPTRPARDEPAPGAVRPDSVPPVESSLPLPPPPWESSAARPLPADPGRKTPVSPQEALRPPFSTLRSQSAPGGTAGRPLGASIEPPPVPPSAPDPLGPGRPARAGAADPSPTARSPEESSGEPLGADGPGSVLPAPRGQEATPRSRTTPSPPGPSRTPRADAADSGGEIIDWLFNEGQGKK
jgi:general secretion pathway protein A